jgi:hypothetical protein
MCKAGQMPGHLNDGEYAIAQINGLQTLLLGRNLGWLTNLCFTSCKQGFSLLSIHASLTATKGQNHANHHLHL